MCSFKPFCKQWKLEKVRCCYFPVRGPTKSLIAPLLLEKARQCSAQDYIAGPVHTTCCEFTEGAFYCSWIPISPRTSSWNEAEQQFAFSYEWVPPAVQSLWTLARGQNSLAKTPWNPILDYDPLQRLRSQGLLAACNGTKPHCRVCLHWTTRNMADDDTAHLTSLLGCPSYQDLRSHTCGRSRLSSFSFIRCSPWAR